MPSKITTNVMVQAMKKAGLDPTNPAHMEAFAEAYADAVNQAIHQAATKTLGSQAPEPEPQPEGSDRTGRQLIGQAYGEKHAPAGQQQNTRPAGKGKTGTQTLRDYYTQGEK